MKRAKGILSVLLVVLLLAGCLPMTAWAAPSGSDGKYGGGEGTEENPYLITSAVDMKTLSETPEDWDKYFKVNQTINLSSVCGETLNGGTSWTPIGNNKGRPFSGVFDGAHHKITGLYIHAEDSDYQGLFGSIRGGSVKDLRVYGDVTGKDNVGILTGALGKGTVTNCYTYGSVSGNERVGGLSGSNYGDDVMEDCHNAATVTGEDVVGGIAGQNFGSLLHCYNTGRVNGSGWFGGATGINAAFGLVSNCYNSGTVNGHNVGFGGGFVGANYDDAIIEYCFNSGDVIAVEGAATYSPGIVGGVAGWNHNIVRNCYNSGNINASYAAGGVIGHLSGQLETCFNTGKVTSMDMFGALISGGIAGDIDASGGTAIHCYYLAGTADGGVRGEDIPGAAEAVGKLKLPSFNQLSNSGAAAAYSGVMALDAPDETEPEDELVMPSFSELTGFSADIWADSTAASHPVLKLNAENAYQDEDGTYLISSLEALEWFRDEVNSGNNGISAKLTADIDMAGKYNAETGESWKLIETFAGTFDGNGNKIIGLYAHTDGAASLFSMIDEDGIIQNLGILDGSVAGENMVGGIVIRNCGIVRNCYFIGDVTGKTAVGGIVSNGTNTSTIENCYHVGNVTGTDYAANGTSDFIGGVIGYSVGRVANCYHSGSVHGRREVGGIVGLIPNGTSQTENCYNTGTVTGIKYVGGIVGKGGTIENCYSIGSVSADDEEVGGIAGDPFYYSSTVTNCYYLENTADGGIAGEDEIGHAESITVAELADKHTFVNWNFTTVWGMSTDENDMRPVLRPIPEHEYDDSIPEIPDDPKCDCHEDCTCTDNCQCTAGSCNCKNCPGNTGGTTTPSTPTVPDEPDEPDEPEKPTPSVSDFKDVVPGSYYYDAVDWAVENGIAAGTSDTSFSPNAACSRAQVVTFLWRAKGSPKPLASVNPFKDVDPERYYYQAVLWANEQGIAVGTGANQFSPNRSCSRGQVVTFLWRAEGCPEPVSKVNPFTDVKPNSTYYKAILWAYENGIASGTSKTAFSPNASCSRAQTVTFLYRNLAK